MKLALIGHRGVGKSSLLRRLGSYLPEIPESHFVCLDHEITKSLGQPISEIFISGGEEAFRETEKRVFQSLVESFESAKDCVVALGAGYQGEIPESWKVLWIQRGIAMEDALFLDRPPLDHHTYQGLGMSLERFRERESRYAHLSDSVLLLEEHQKSHCLSEAHFFRHLFKMVSSLDIPKNYFLTLSKSHRLTDVEAFPGWELRDDLLTQDEIGKWADLGGEKSLLSFRDPEKVQQTQRWLSRCKIWDWPLELGDCPLGSPPIHSLHRREETFEKTLELLSCHRGMLKLAVSVNSFDELLQGHHWQKESPETRIFLPISSDGRWQWYRRWASSLTPLHFFRTGRTGSGILDQPTLLQALQVTSETNFAAVLGHPVNHSLTPWFHGEFFGAQNMATYSIAIHEAEWSSAMTVLEELGLRYAAVTSPLKKQAGKQLGHDGPLNTLAFQKGQWVGTNTDGYGLEAWAERLQGKTLALWGGGGTLGTVSKIFKSLFPFSSRTGEARVKGQEVPPDFEGILWAVGRRNFDRQGLFPPETWHPKVLLDLNYSIDSPGRACAKKLKCEYVGGMEMFIRQARKQQEFWASLPSGDGHRLRPIEPSRSEGSYVSQ